MRNKTSTILSCLGATGVIITSALAIRATPKAYEKIKADSRSNHNGDPYAYTRKEAFLSAWHYYIPTTVIGASTIVCIFGANTLNKRQQASITSAYALLNQSFQEYKNKLKELYGEEAHQKIIDSIMIEKTDDVYIHSIGSMDCISLSFDERDEKEHRLFYDSFSKRYFESTVAQVLEAEYHFNRNWILGSAIYINEWYTFLGIEGIEGGDSLGWFWCDEIAWIDFNHHKVTLEDGLEVYVIDIVYDPRLETDED